MIAIYPGSFDPITRGHADVIEKAIAVFGKENIRIVVMNNQDKNHFLDVEDRVKLAKEAFSDVRVESHEGMISDLINQEEHVFIIRGLRNVTDFEYEQTLQAFTSEFGATTVYFTPGPENLRVSSSFVRHLISAGHNCDKYMPDRFSAATLEQILVRNGKI